MHNSRDQLVITITLKNTLFHKARIAKLECAQHLKCLHICCVNNDEGGLMHGPYKGIKKDSGKETLALTTP